VPGPTTPPPRPEPREGFVAVGFVRGPRGVRGELKVEPLTDFPQRFQPGAVLWAGGVQRTVRSVRVQRDLLLVALEGIDDRHRADALRSSLLEVPETALPALAEGSYFRFQIEGMEVFDRAGRSLGRVEEVLATGANDVYVVRSETAELLIPAIDSVVKTVDVPGRRMVVDLPPGLEPRPLRRRPSDRC
jgi:16S rRNA processing protein RimM